MYRRSTPLHRNRLVWVSCLTLGILFAGLLIPRTSDQPPNPAESIRDAMTGLSKGDRVDLPLGGGVTLPVDPITDKNGNPVDVAGAMEVAKALTPALLAAAEERYGAKDARTILVRSSAVTQLMLKGQHQKAKALADENLEIAIALDAASAELKLKAVKSVLTATQNQPGLIEPEQLLELGSLLDRYASEAPALGVELYNGIGMRLHDLGRSSDAEWAHQNAADLGASAAIPSFERLNAHIALSGLAWQRGDCPTALIEAATMMDLTDHADILAKTLHDFTVRQMTPMIDHCARDHDLGKDLKLLIAQSRR